MKLFNVLLKLSPFLFGKAIALGPTLAPESNNQSHNFSIMMASALENQRYPVSYFIRTPDTPQSFCGSSTDLTVTANNVDHNVTIRNCEALRDMYANYSSADGNGYWNFTFGASERNNTSGLSQFTVDFDGDCDLKMGLVDYSKVPLSIRVGNTDVYYFINEAVSGANFTRTTGQVMCNDGVQVVWGVGWRPGSIGH
ncbi:hypothetical protein VPNG_05846 [Cytospora leucostoma]|uniref:Ecp2 effector protein domain-containing protein n=1 Tax=Cytospora leucostoma TaxID=1230097 RepID=A0A423X0I8_9PEZI|nr:hypothetical protein VPNG_05846 [Cytospora leucostoma]